MTDAHEENVMDEEAGAGWNEEFEMLPADKEDEIMGQGLITNNHNKHDTNLNNNDSSIIGTNNNNATNIINPV
jgi:hypothetical protein